MSAAPLILVSGLGRCGTSLMMQMLDAGGIRCAGEYPAFEVAGIDLAFLQSCTAQGIGAVKCLDPHRWNFRIANNLDAIVIWLDRNPRQQARSQIKMLKFLYPEALRGDLGELGAERRIHASLVLERADAMRVACFGRRRFLVVRFENLLAHAHAELLEVMAHLSRVGIAIDGQRAVGVVRKRSSDCFPGLLELELERSVCHIFEDDLRGLER